MIGVFLPRDYGKIQFINLLWRSNMKYSVKWVVPCIPFVQGEFGSSEQFIITRYDCGNYTISDGDNTRRITVKQLQDSLPGALEFLKKKAGVRRYACS